VFGLSPIIDGMKKMIGTSKICPEYESLGWSYDAKACLDFPNWGDKKTRSSQIAPNVIRVFDINKYPIQNEWWKYMNYKQSDCPSLGLGLIKMDYFKVGQGLGLERRILYEQKMEFHEE